MIGVTPDGRRLATIGKLVDDGQLHPLVQAFPLEQSKEAGTLPQSSRRGKNRPDYLIWDYVSGSRKIQFRR
jgi:hypothetical protein